MEGKKRESQIEEELSACRYMLPCLEADMCDEIVWFSRQMELIASLQFFAFLKNRMREQSFKCEF